MFEPPSKIGNAMLGANDHAAVPALNRPPSVGRRAERGRQRDLREERRACRTDVRVRRQQRLLGLHHVRTTREQIRRQPGRHVRQQVLRVERHARRQVVRQRLADQQHQRVQRLRACPCLRLLVRQRLLDHCLRLTQLGSARAVVELQLRQVVRVLRRLQRVLRDLQQIVGRQQRQVLIRHLRHQRDLRRLPRIRGRQVLRERLILQALHAAEQVEFPRRRQADVVGRRDVAARRHRQRIRQALTITGTRRIERREQPRARDLVLRARRLDVQHRYAQVAVVLQRDLDQPLQARIDEELAPADGGRSLPVRAARAGRTRLRRVDAAGRVRLRDGHRAACNAAPSCSPWRRARPRLQSKRVLHHHCPLLPSSPLPGFSSWCECS